MKKEKLLRNKNLLIITNGYPCKEWEVNHTFVKAQVDELKKHFNKIYVISQNPFFPKFLSRLKFIPQLYKDYSKTKNYKYDNVEVYFPRYFSFPEKIFPKFRLQSCFKSVLNCINKNKIKFDLIHAHFAVPSGYVAVKLKEKFKKKVVITLHRNRNVFLNEYNFNVPGLIQTWEGADLLIRVNKIDLPLLKKYNKNAINIPNGFDNTKFKKLDEKVNVPRNKKIILHVGNYLISHKNQINLIKALIKLRKKRQDFIAYLIGRDGGDESKIRDFVNKNKLGDFVKVVGAKPHNEIPLWMNSADIFILPSYSESFGVVNVEALACGIPVISTINGGSEEIIVSEDCGFIYKNPNDFKKLSELINKSLNKKWNYQRILEYSQKFTWKKACDKMIKEYERLLK